MEGGMGCRRRGGGREANGEAEENAEGNVVLPLRALCLSICVVQVQGRVKETVYEQDSEGRGLVPVRENIFHPDELSYIEGGCEQHDGV